jgi:hypothetical protein
MAGSEKLPMVMGPEPPEEPPAEEPPLLLLPQAARIGARPSAAPVPAAPRITSLRVYERVVRSLLWSLMLRSFGCGSGFGDGETCDGVEQMEVCRPRRHTGGQPPG